MEITEVRIKLTAGKNEKLRAFCSITIDNDFVIRDLKVIEGAKGAFVAMPSRKLMARCPYCGGKNHYRAPFCNECGGRLSPEKLSLDGRRKLHADVAHPINSNCREAIQQHVLAHFQAEQEKAKDPDYRPADLDDFDDDFFDDEGEVVAPAAGSMSDRAAVKGGGASEDPLAAADARELEVEPQTYEENEWEEHTARADGEEVERADVDSDDRRAAFAAAAEKADERPEKPLGDAAPRREGRARPDGSSGAKDAGPRDRGGSQRPGSRGRQRGGGRRRRGREPRRDGPRERDGSRFREVGGRGADRSPLAVEFDDLRPERSRSGGWKEERAREGGQREREREAGALRDPKRERRERVPEKRHVPQKNLIDESDPEPEDNFGAGLFS